MNPFEVPQSRASSLRSALAGVLGMILFSSLVTIGWADNSEKPSQAQADLTQLSLEELMTMEVTSVAKKPQKLSDSAAAIFVITQDDIRRSGVIGLVYLAIDKTICIRGRYPLFRPNACGKFFVAIRRKKAKWRRLD